jgi:type IV pilus assembly protein PilE
MKSKARGFTLIEVMIVVVIIGILASIAYPSYVEQVRKGSRTEAKTALLEGAQALERFYSVNGTYLGAPATLAAVFPASVPGKYNIAAAAGTAPTATSYRLRATRTGSMAGDPCGDFEITHTGVRAIQNATRTVAECW